MEHLVSPTDPVSLKTLNPGFASLYVAGPTTLAGSVSAAIARNVTQITAAQGNTTLTTANAGMIRVLASTVPTTLTLPDVVASKGLSFEFFWTGFSDGTHGTQVSSANGNCISGYLYSNIVITATTPSVTAVQSLSVINQTNVVRSPVAQNTSAGDRLRFSSDGTVWYVDGSSGGTTQSGISWSTS